MKWMTLNEVGDDPKRAKPIYINTELIFSLKAIGQPGSHEGTIINGTLTVREDIDTITGAAVKLTKTKKPVY